MTMNSSDYSHRFVTSWCLPPYVLGTIRALFALYVFSAQVFIIGWLCIYAEHSCATAFFDFSYLTVLSYWGLGFYFLVSSVYTFTYARTGTAPLDGQSQSRQGLYALFYATITVYPFLVTAVYWGGIFPGRWFPLKYEAWSNLSRHALNLAFALFEIVMTRTDLLTWSDIIWLLTVLALYLGLASIIRIITGVHVYSFLDPVKVGSLGLVGVYILCIATGCVILFLFVQRLIALRTWLTEDKLGFNGKFSHNDARYHIRSVDIELVEIAPPANRIAH